MFDMVEVVCREWLEYVFWINIGFIDVEYGYVLVFGVFFLIELVEEFVE